MSSRSKTLYGVTLVLIALLIVSVIAGIYYYYEYGQVTQSRNQYVNELASATGQYGNLASYYNSSLALDNETLSLLAGTVAAINTSLPIYKQASAELSNLWSQYVSLKPPMGSLYSADILVDFGNETRHWYNNTQIQPGWNMYVTTVVLSGGNLQAQWYPQYQEHFITGMDGISNSGNTYWFLWTYNSTAGWQVAQVGVDDLPVYNASIFAWTYCGETPSYAPTCTP